MQQMEVISSIKKEILSLEKKFLFGEQIKVNYY